MIRRCLCWVSLLLLPTFTAMAADLPTGQAAEPRGDMRLWYRQAARQPGTQLLAELYFLSRQYHPARCVTENGRRKSNSEQVMSSA